MTARFSRFLMTAAFGAAALAAGCGYHSVSSYLNHIRTIRIPTVINQSALYELSDEMTQELTRRFASKWSPGDDSELLMTVSEYDYEPIAYDVNNQPERYRMWIRVNYQFYDRVKDKMIANRRDFEFHHDFWVVAGRGEDPEDEPTARKRLLEEFVDLLYNTLAEQW